MTATPGGGVIDAERRAALNAAKLRAVVDARWGAAPRQPGRFGSGAALVGSDDGEPVAWLLVDEVPERSLGPALLWGERRRVRRLHVIVDGAEAAGALARQAVQFAPPVPGVHLIEGASLLDAEPAPPPVPAVPVRPPALVDLLVEAGLEVVAEGGVLRGEVDGLEVARLVTGETTAGVPIDAPQLEVGVGKADRELTAMVHGELAPVDQLDRVVAIVRRHRTAGAPPHPLNQLVPERWLRAVLCREPRLVGLASLRPAEGARPRPNLRDRGIAVAAGEDADGDPVVVACAVGVALDLVPLAADARATLVPAARLVLALPERDDVPPIRRLAARLRHPADVVPIPGDWRRQGSR